MPTTTYELYDASDLVFSGSTVTLVSGYDGSNDVTLVVDDDDDVLEGDLYRNEDGNDTNQYGTATFADGSSIGGSSTTVYSEQQYTLTASGYPTITLYQMEVDSNPFSTAGAGILAGYLPSAPLEPGVTYSITVTNTVPNNDPTYSEIEGAVCFTRGTRILTPDGYQLIEDICAGDMVETSEGAKPVRWIGSQCIDERSLSHNEKLYPVKIVAGSLGLGLPQNDLWVSRQHRMVIRSKITQRMFDEAEVLVPAIRLTTIPGVFVDEGVTSVEYFHMLFDQHEVVYAEGAPTESLFTGPQALKTLPNEMCEEIFSIFPQLRDFEYPPALCRFVPERKQQNQCIARHVKNKRDVLR